MRLKDGEDSLEVGGFGGAKRCANFGGVMRVVVDDRDAVARLHLESPIDAAKIFEGGGNDGRFHSAHVGDSSRNERSLSSASSTKKSPLPKRALLPIVFRIPPTTTVGSSPARSRIVASIDVVVVFP